MSASPIFDGLLASAEELLPWMSEIRRDLHQNPELGLEEHRTSARVREVLDQLGIEHIDGLAGTGVLGLIRGDDRGPVVALRADLDALPLHDAKDVPYRSRTDGKMHACGHDAHTTMLLGAAHLLASREDLGGTVKLIFQPAEETVGGARLLIEEGVLQNPTVDAIFGLHVEPELDVGRVGLHYGQRNASSDDLNVIIHGRSGHAAYPASTVDAIVVAAHVVTALQTVVSRNVDARKAAVVSFGTVRGGNQANIVADRVELIGTLRTLDRDVRETTRRRIRELAESIAAGFGGRAEVIITPSYDPVINDNEMVELVRRNTGALLGEGRVDVYGQPNMGVEDFGYYLTVVPGAFYSLGVRNEEAGIVHPVHHQLFDIDERSLALGAALQAANALAVLAENGR